MKLIRFLQRAFHGGTIVEPGTEMMVEDHVGLGAHMLDLTPGVQQSAFVPRVVSVFRPDLAHVPGPVVPVLSPDEIRAKATEEAIARADRTREAEAVAMAVSIKPVRTPKDQPAVG